MKTLYVNFIKKNNRKRSAVPKDTVENLKEIAREYGYEIISCSRRMRHLGITYTDITEIYPIDGIYLEFQVHDFFKKLNKENN